MSSFLCRISVLYAIYRTVFPGYRQVVILNAGIVVICVLFAIFMPKIGTIIRFR
jgi:sodium-coupled neutral amino acid transporter 9